MQLTVYTKPDCHLCDELRPLLEEHTAAYDLDITEVNILEDKELYEAYKEKIPVVVAEDGRYGWLYPPITGPELRNYLSFARRGGRHVFVYSETKLDHFLNFISAHWLFFVCLGMGLYVGLPWLAPIFAALGWWGLAQPIYVLYAVFCHQLPERSAILFGYEVATCWRCVALYGGILLFGILFGIARDHKVPWLQWLRRPLRWYWFVLMLMPIFLDGITHMLGYRDGLLGDDDVTFGNFFIGSQLFSLNWILRIATGLLAALGTAWFIFPRMSRVIEESQDVQQAYRQAVAAQRVSVAGGQQA